MPEEKEIKEVKKKEQKDSYALTEVATETMVMITNQVTGDIMNESQAIALILNKLDRIERGLL